jgi:GGDEF domain-containing protein
MQKNPGCGHTRFAASGVAYCAAGNCDASFDESQLEQIAEALARGAKVSARLEGDGFTIIVEEPHEQAAAGLIANALRAEITSLRRALAAVVLSKGGVVEVPTSDFERVSLRSDHIDFTASESEDGATRIIGVRLGA